MGDLQVPYKGIFSRDINGGLMGFNQQNGDLMGCTLW